MKRSTFLLLSSALLFSTIHCHRYVEEFTNKINTLQEAIATLISQSDVDPDVAQDIMDKANELSQYTQDNIQQDLKEIRVAAGLTSILETADRMLQSMNMANPHELLTNFKYSARANAIHKLLIGAYPGRFKDQPYYTDPYTESIGFTLNDYFFNALFNVLLSVITPTALGSALKLDSSSPAKRWVTRTAAGITAHYVWLLQKKLAASQLNEQA